MDSYLVCESAGAAPRPFSERKLFAFFNPRCARRPLELVPRHHATALCIHNSLSGTDGRGFGYGSNVSWLLGVTRNRDFRCEHSLSEVRLVR